MEGNIIKRSKSLDHSIYERIRLDKGASLPLIDPILFCIDKIKHFIFDETLIKQILEKDVVIDFFRIAMFLKQPEKYLEQFLKYEITKREKTAIFRDSSYSNQGITLFIEIQFSNPNNSHLVIEAKQRKTYREFSSKILRKTKHMLKRMNMLIFPSSIIFLCKSIKQICQDANKDVQKMLLSFIFLRVIIPRIVNPDSSRITKRGNNQISKVIISLVNEIVNDKDAENLKKFKNQELIQECKSKIKEFIKNLNLKIYEIEFHSQKFQNENLLNIVTFLLSYIEENKNCLSNYAEDKRQLERMPTFLKFSTNSNTKIHLNNNK